MNLSIVLWFAGALLTIYGIKFVFLFVREMFSKDTMESVMDAAGATIKNMNKSFTRYLKRKARERREKTKEKNLPMVTIE